MANGRLKIGLVLSSNFAGYPQGGGQPIIETFLNHCKDKPYDIWLLGMTTSKDEPIGQVSRRVIYGREFPFLPLFSLDAEKYRDRKPLVPIRAKAFLAYLRRKSLVDALGFDLLYLHEPQAIPFYWPKRQPILYHIHGTQEGAAEYSRYGFVRSKPFLYLYQKGLRTIYERSDEFIVIDDLSQTTYTGMYPERATRFHLVPTGVDTQQFRPIPDLDKRVTRKKFGLPENGKMFLFVGRLHWKKGIDFILRSFALLKKDVPDAFLAIAGEGEERQRMKQLTDELQMSDAVYFLGTVPRFPKPDLALLYNSADVSVVGSVEESFALVITEALACGVPVVSTLVGIAPKVIRDGVTGYLLKERDERQMSFLMKSALTSPTIDRQQCVATAQEYGDTVGQICGVIESMKAESGSCLAASRS
jgi:glycosyltransferase involved in cell wall biosynthesis